MTPIRHSPQTTDRRTPAPTGTEAAGVWQDEDRQVAIAALLHRVSGGLNNAAMAFELEISPAGGGAAPSQRVMRAGLSGVTQAARASTLLAELLMPGTTNGDLQARLNDVIEVLRSRAAASNVALHIEERAAQSEADATTAALAVASLRDGLAALGRAHPGEAVSLAIAQGEGGARLRAT